jgi:uncharacterized glyoxalase superfamily metalloenzyme YdcJ
MKKIILINILSILMLTSLFAQERPKHGPEMWEKIKAEKVAFFTTKLDLTPSEAQEFWPVYNELEKKRFDIQREIREFERISDEDYAKLSEADILKRTNNYIESFEKEANLRKEYHKQFLKILPQKKVLLMYRTENDFRSHMIRQYRKD